MKKLLVSALAVMLSLSFLPINAQASEPVEPKNSIEFTISNKEVLEVVKFDVTVEGEATLESVDLINTDVTKQATVEKAEEGNTYSVSYNSDLFLEGTDEYNELLAALEEAETALAEYKETEEPTDPDTEEPTEPEQGETRTADTDLAELEAAVENAKQNITNAKQASVEETAVNLNFKKGEVEVSKQYASVSAIVEGEDSVEIEEETPEVPEEDAITVTGELTSI